MSEPSRREQLIERLANHLLDSGLASASLRPMAAAAGTSDRMLLYYFETREALLTAVLEHVAKQMATLLEAAVPPQPLPYPVLLRRLRSALGAPALGRYMQLWLEIAARAARGEAPYPTIGTAIGDAFLGWAEARLAIDAPADARAVSALLLATLDGLALLDCVGLGDDANAALEVI